MGKDIQDPIVRGCIDFLILSFLVFVFFWLLAKSNGVWLGMEECENAMISQDDKCIAYYLTTEEIKLIDRLGE